MIPTRCHLWQKENITPEDFDWETVKTYWDHSHEWRSLMRCKRCGQLYINDNVENVDWLEGNDTIDTTIVPVSEKELEKYETTSLELLAFEPILLWNSEGSLKWVRNNPLKS